MASIIDNRNKTMLESLRSLGVGTKTRTAYKFLIGKGRVQTLDELINRFSVEVVNKQFYSEIATSFTALVGGDRDGKHYEKLLKIYGTEDHNIFELSNDDIALIENL